MTGKNSKLLLLILCLYSVSGYGKPPVFSIRISDQSGILNNRVDYLITNDSLKISAVSDYGRSQVNYLQRRLSKQESRGILKFLKTFPIDSLDDAYFNEPGLDGEFAVDGLIRIIDITLIYGKQYHPFKITNCWVAYAGRLFNMINPLLPPEVRIRYEKNKFNAFY